MTRARTRQGTIGDEVRGADLGDFRRTRRLVKLIERMAEQPDASFPSVLDDAELEAAYRLLGNEHVNVDAILAPHVRATVERIRREDVVLALHDTTTMSFRAEGQREDLDRRHALGTQQFFSHHTFAVSGDGSRRPLGNIALSIHTRRSDPDEHDRWASNVSRVHELGESHRIVHVMDREADDYALFARFARDKLRFIVRLQHDRVLRSPELDGVRLREVLETSPIVEMREVALSRRFSAGRGPKDRKVHPAREGRIASLAVSAMSIAFPRPRKARKELPDSLTVNVVCVKEVDTPVGETPVEWLLVTTEPIETTQQILQVVDWYRARWVIEEFFKALKTGCSFQKRQLHDLHGLSNALGLFIPIAWQLLVLRSEARERPTSPATAVLPPDEMQVLRRIARRPLPKGPTARDVYLAIAALGGHLKHNGEPGWQVLGRGYEKLLTITEGWRLRREVEAEPASRHAERCAYDQS